MKQSTQPMIYAATVVLMSGRCLVSGQQGPIPFAPEPNTGMPSPPSMTAPGIPTQPGPDTGYMPAPDVNLDPTHKRDPFWPVNYTPKKITHSPSTGSPKTEGNPAGVYPEKLKTPDWDTARKLLDIRGVSLIGRDKQSNAPKYLAMVGGKLVEVGDTVYTLYDDQTYRWKVASITANGISLVKIDVRHE
jgi:hypothetical protein